MATFTVAIDVADFALGSTPRELAFATFARASIDTTGSVIVTAAPASVRLVDGRGMIELQAGVPYRVRFYGVAGLETPFYVLASADCTAADLRQNHQVDPDDLTAAPVPQTVAELIEAVRTGPAGGFLGGTFPNPGVNEAALINVIGAAFASNGDGGGTIS